MKTAELFNKNMDDSSTSLMDFEGFKKALTEHDKEIKANRLDAGIVVKLADITNIIDDIIDWDASPYRGYNRALIELKNKLNSKFTA